MKKLLLLLFLCLLPFLSKEQTANAGSDQTIYLSSTNSATLDGSASSGTSYLWTEISSDYTSGAKITNATSKTAIVSPLPQGVFYFQIAVTTGATIVYDTTVITVDYEPAPTTGTLLRSTQMGNDTIYNYINDRSDTTQLSGYPSGTGTSEGSYYFDRGRSNSMFIDSHRSKFYSILEDGYHWQADPSYSRVEGSYGTGWNFDTTKIYEIVWKGYFPQNFSNFATNKTVGAIMQVHPGAAGTYVPFGFSMINGIDGENSHRGTVGVKGLYFVDMYPADTIGGYYYLMSLDSMVNKTHTIRLIMREGADNPLLEVKVDGVTKYIRTTGFLSITPNEDYPKFATLYDYNNALVDPTNHTRNRKFKMVTEEYKIYSVTDTSTVAAPTIPISPSTQDITTSTTTPLQQPLQQLQDIQFLPTHGQN